MKTLRIRAVAKACNKTCKSKRRMKVKGKYAKLNELYYDIHYTDGDTKYIRGFRASRKVAAWNNIRPLTF